MGYYFFSNDQYNWTPTYQADDAILIGVANHQLLHVIGDALRNGIQFRRIVAVDNNKEQLSHLQRLVESAIRSDSIEDYVQDVLCVDAGNLHVGCGFPSLCGEEGFWSKAKFDAEAFSARHGIQGKNTGRSIRIESPVCGGFSVQHLTLVNNEHHRYTDGYPFPMGLWSGYLMDPGFWAAKTDFGKIEYVHQPIEDYCVQGILQNRYAPHLIWASNLFTPFFMDQNPKLKRLLNQLTQMGTQAEPNFPELQVTVLQDSRIPVDLHPMLNGPMRPRSIHSETFRAVAKHIPIGQQITEISNQPVWVAQDQGVSKLGGKHLHIHETNRLESPNTILLHILAGHGMPKDEFRSALQKYRELSNRLIVLEHNAGSSDFGENVWVDPDWIRSVLGDEQALDYVCPNKRNFVMVY